MKRLLAAVAAGASLFSAGLHAESPPLAHFVNPEARFSDALGARDLEIEALLNTSPDSSRTKDNLAKKGDVKDKASGTLFGNIRDNAGINVCGLVLANGSFMFSCSPSGVYSVDTITDAQGLVTLFGFADGHFPYKQTLSGFGRWDMNMVIANSAPPPPPPPVTNSTITFNITDGCNNGISIDYKFYDVTNNLVWPSATSHYFTSAFNATYTHNLLCTTNAKVCYGARSATFYWGIDVDGSKSCSDCCIFCNEGGSLSRRLTC